MRLLLIDQSEMSLENDEGSQWWLRSSGDSNEIGSMVLVEVRGS